ncbi:hypothetical protein BC624_11443 [Flavobacterium granuli]|uniref:Uncharacterized protein n=1 Tax=Flavobacterium granuli TaxID=280093 RepID=A0A1M5TQR5_9FLAO|nr:hypothetical protein BC624_11443 [Flavobacterium granuli]SHH53165.1 hypothetical protein SAMN05443373_11543 [Flavobacterium granuli]
MICNKNIILYLFRKRYRLALIYPKGGVYPLLYNVYIQVSGKRNRPHNIKQDNIKN